MIFPCLRASSRVRAGGLLAANFAFSRKTRRNASSYGLSKEIIVVVCLFLSIHLYLLHFRSEDSYQTDIKIDDESVKAEVIDTAGNVSRASCYSMTVFLRQVISYDTQLILSLLASSLWQAKRDNTRACCSRGTSHDSPNLVRSLVNRRL